MQQVRTESDTGETPIVLAFDSFYRTHRDRLYRALVITIRDADVAGEAIDEAMARAAERWDTIGTYEAPEGWVYRVGLNWARSVFRRKRHVLQPPELMWDALPDPDVTRAVAALPYKLRVVVVARYYLDWTNPEVASGLDIPLGTVKSRVHRALAQLESTLGGPE